MLINAHHPFHTGVLGHRGIGAGAKLCYIRLLGFAGKDARCYPSLETSVPALGCPSARPAIISKSCTRPS
jgi:hypothetical protein